MRSSGAGLADVVLGGGTLHAGDVEAVARHGAGVVLDDTARAKIERSNAMLRAAMADGEPHYGVNTGFGSFSRTRIDDAQLRDLQTNLIRSHSAGVGEPLPTDVVRGMMLLLAGSLSRGRSGVRVCVVETIVGMLNAGLTPVVPAVGSVGASGDLAPLSHVALAMIGEGEVTDRAGKRVRSADAMASAKVATVALEAKEGLALINGTHLMAAEGALLVGDARRLFSAALCAAAMSIDACRATDSFLDPRVYEARNQPGPARVAGRLTSLMGGSQIIASHRLNDPRVQDPYSLRCVAPVLGAADDLLGYVESRVADELGAVTDNPLVLETPGGAGEIVSAGNFHGMPIAVPLDVLSIALCHIAGIAERRVYHMLSGFDPETGLPPYLSPSPGLHSGLMIAQYTAAACCNEMIGLANPASVANISTSAGMEDYNSFGPRSASKARRAMELARYVVATELVSASEAIEHHRPLRSGDGVERAFDVVRGVVPKLSADRPPGVDVMAVAGLIESGAFSAGI